MAAIAIAIPVVVALPFMTATGRGWEQATALAVGPWERDGWRVLRGGVKWIAPPFVCLAVIWVLFHLTRQGRSRTAATAFLVGAGAFLTVEGIKLGYVPFPAFRSDGTRELSGHVAMTASAYVVAVLGLPQRPSIGRATAWLLLAGMCLAILASRWHGTADIVIALGVTIGWVLGARAGFAVALARQGSSAARPTRTDVLISSAAALAATTAVLVVVLGDPTLRTTPVRALAAGGLAIVAMTLVLATFAARLAGDSTLWEEQVRRKPRAPRA
jgi:divalent metal cation (Fe/Co/Zn/Cd) transporter